MSAYRNDSRVQIGLYDAYVGDHYIFAATRDDWVVGPREARSFMDDNDAIGEVIERCPHFTSFDEAIRSLIGDPQ
uniref:hypothetical protein n=1 Tax=Paractinoplanes polyasparticus TaxID=2856853 RepID=UPI001C8558C5|nr:hypothetical protein [Actinoplanes polyasparticus]